jgi:ubiquinone/menaquinone biosynthesis C-methylase UbiE
MPEPPPLDVGALWESNAETWTRHVRSGFDVDRDQHNTPAFLAFLPDVAGRCGLDIGCGEAANTRALARRGARMTAIDIAPTFVRHAREAEAAEPLGIEFLVGNAEALPFADQAFDFATAFMCFMDVANPRAALREAHRVVRPGGFLQFSILHPCFDPPHRRLVRGEDGRAVAIEIGRYFDTTPTVETWRFSNSTAAERAMSAPFRVAHFHRPISEWINELVETGWTVERLNEPSTTPELVATFPSLSDLLVAPLFLQIRARRA